MSHHLDPLALEQTLHDIAGYSHAADIFNLTTGYRLAIRDSDSVSKSARE